MAKLTSYASATLLNEGMFLYVAIDTNADGSFESRKASLATLRSSLYDTNSRLFMESKGSDIASAAALTIGTDGNYFDVTGTVAITSINTVKIGVEVTLQFDDVVTITHHATNLITPNAQDMVTQAGDHVVLREYDTGMWRVVSSTIVTDLGVVAFIPISAPSHVEGLVYYDQAEFALSYYNEEADVTINLGQESLVRVRNSTGVTITDGTVVEITGSTGEIAEITPAIADPSHICVLGLATHSIENNTTGYVTTFGIVRDVDTLGMTAGNRVYLSDTVAGEYTESEPAQGNEKIQVGVVIKVAAAGKIFISVRHVYQHEAPAGAVYPIYMDAVPQALSGPGAIDIVSPVTNFTSTGATDALTLVDSTLLGQIKVINHSVDGGGYVLTPTTLNGGTTITVTDVSVSISLMWTALGWRLVSQTGVATIA